jgi:hypothetical protein
MIPMKHPANDLRNEGPPGAQSEKSAWGSVHAPGLVKVALTAEPQRGKPRSGISRNLWPWAIILVFVVFISGTISLVVMACSQKVDLVSADYYEQEIKFQRHIDQLDRTHRLAGNAAVAYEPDSRRIRIVLPSEARAGAITGRVQLYRPSAAGLDRQFKLEANAEGVQFLDASALQRGLWKVRVSWTVGSTEYFLDQSIKVIGG